MLKVLKNTANGRYKEIRKYHRARNSGIAKITQNTRNTCPKLPAKVL
jgi:hypothetical protein